MITYGKNNVFMLNLKYDICHEKLVTADTSKHFPNEI